MSVKTSEIIFLSRSVSL